MKNNPFGTLAPHAHRQRLEILRDKVGAAEGQLRNARDLLEAEVVAQNLPTAGLFGGYFYVSRSSAESWLADAKAEANARELSALRRLAEKTDDPDEPDDNEGDDSDHTPPKNKKAKKKVAEPEEEPADAYRDRVMATAAAVIRAGQRARGSTEPAIEVQDPYAAFNRMARADDFRDAYAEQCRSVASQIIKAGEKRRKRD